MLVRRDGHLKILLNLKVCIIFLEGNKSLCMKNHKNMTFGSSKNPKEVIVSRKSYLYEFLKSLLIKVKNLEILKNKGLVNKLWFLCRLRYYTAI